MASRLMVGLFSYSSSMASLRKHVILGPALPKFSSLSMEARTALESSSNSSGTHELGLPGVKGVKGVPTCGDGERVPAVDDA